MRGTIFLDHNATTRPFPEVVETVAHHLYHSYANPGSRHSYGRTARKVLEKSRESIAALLGAHPREVVFTSGGTESTNLALFGCTQQRPGTIALTRGEHPATREACRRLELMGWKLQFLDVDRQGRLLPEQYTELDWESLRLVTVILAHNETGVIQDVSGLAEHCRRHGVPLHLDAVQAVGKIPVHFHDLQASFLSLGAHKFYGPRGIGALLVRDGCELAPYLFGGHQERERRPGTEPVALIAGMARALELCAADAERKAARMTRLRDRLQNGLAEAFSDAVVHGAEASRLPNTLNIAFPGLNAEALLVALDLDGIACSVGSTCASGAAEPAPVLVAMGCGPELYQSSLRFSVGLDNTIEQIDEALRRIVTVVRRMQQSSAPAHSSES